MNFAKFVVVTLLLALPGSAHASCGCLTISKIFDTNANGVQDSGEVGIPGWAFQVQNLATKQFNYYNSSMTVYLPYGNYQVCDRAPAQFNWYLTSSSLCNNYSITSQTCVAAVSDCLCTGPSTVPGSSYWFSTPNPLVAADFSLLAGLPLVDAGLNPATIATSSALHAFYVGATLSSAPAYYLSAQLALISLNAAHFVSGSQLVKAFIITGSPSNPFAPLSAVIAKAVTLLATPTINTDVITAVAKVLQAANTNQGFGQTSPATCPFSFPAVTAPVTDLSSLCVMSTGTTGTTGCQQGHLALSKFYDRNGNGVQDAGEASLPGWKFKVTNYATKNYAYYVSPVTLDLPFGKFQVCDAAPTQYNWYLTVNPLCRNFTLVDSNVVQATGDCVCTGPAPGTFAPQSTGYWGKLPGSATITDGDIAALRLLNLVKADGTPYSPVNASNFVKWHNAVDMTNIPYYLSDSLAVMTLNVQHGTDASGLVKAAYCAPYLGSTNILVSLASLITYANTLLANPTANQPIQQIFADAIHTFNQNQNFISADATNCPFTFPNFTKSASSSGLQPPCGGTNPSSLLDEPSALAAGTPGSADGSTGSTATAAGAIAGIVGFVVVTAVVAVAIVRYRARKVRAAPVTALPSEASE